MSYNIYTPQVTEFTKDDIQRMTESTKNYKAFEVFVNMLAGAMRGDNDSVFIDLLTYADLQMLKARKTGKTPPKAPDAPQKNNKRYLILTYVVQFDRVHYPLPLKHEAEPSVGSLQQTVQRLRYQLEAHTHTDGKRSQEQRSQQDVQRVMQENHKLKQLLADRNADDDAFEQDQDTIAALEQENDELRRELDNRPDAPTSADRRKLEDARVNAKQVKLLQKQIDSLKDNLRKEKALNAKVQSKFKREYKQLSNDVDKLRTSEARFRQQTKKLTGELASVRAELKRANSSAAAAARVSRRNKTTNASARNRSLSRGSSTSRRASPSPGAHNRSSSRSNAKSNTSTSARSRSRGAFGSSSNLRYHERHVHLCVQCVLVVLMCSVLHVFCMSVLLHLPTRSYTPHTVRVAVSTAPARGPLPAQAPAHAAPLHPCGALCVRASTQAATHAAAHLHTRVIDPQGASAAASFSSMCVYIYIYVYTYLYIHSRPRPGSAASSRGGVPTGQRSSSRGRAARPSSSYATRPYGSTARGSTSKARGSSRSRNTSKENVRPGNSGACV
jgi:hypothetical protein